MTIQPLTIFALFILLLGGFSLLALCQFTHFRAALGKAPSDAQSRVLRLSGLGLLLVSAIIATANAGGYGFIQLICLMTPSALLCLLLVKKRPNSLPFLGASPLLVPFLLL